MKKLMYSYISQWLAHGLEDVAGSNLEILPDKLLKTLKNKNSFKDDFILINGLLKVVNNIPSKLHLIVLCKIITDSVYLTPPLPPIPLPPRLLL